MLGRRLAPIELRQGGAPSSAYEQGPLASQSVPIAISTAWLPLIKSGTA